MVLGRDGQDHPALRNHYCPGRCGNWSLVLLHQVHIYFEFITNALLFGQRDLFFRSLYGLSLSWRAQEGCTIVGSGLQ